MAGNNKNADKYKENKKKTKKLDKKTKKSIVSTLQAPKSEIVAIPIKDYNNMIEELSILRYALGEKEYKKCQRHLKKKSKD